MDGRGDGARPPLHPLGAALLSDLRYPRRHWAQLGDADRVGLYTRQSLYLVLWLACGSALVTAVGRGDAPGRDAILVAGGLLVAGAGHLAMVPALRAFPSVPRPDWRRVGPVVVLGLAYAAVALVAWDDGPRGTATVVVVVAWTLPLSLLPGRAVAGLAVAVGTGLFAIAGGDPRAAAVGLLVSAVILFSGRASLWVLRVVMELDEARRANAQLAVMEERLRFSRDVHDVLGRRLSTIAVQAELASTLAERGDDRAAERMLEVRGVAHEALREARELARGYRGTDFATELEGARSLLGSAGIEVAVDAGELPRAWHEPAGWVVREAVTNILRHSRAARVEIAYADGALRIVDDGAAATTGNDAAEAQGDGAGLRGLRERLEPLGARLDAGSDGNGGWSVVAHLPGSGPLSARTAGPA